MNEDLWVSSYVAFCESLWGLRKSGDWKAWHETWEEYVQQRWGLSKSRAKLLCDFAKFRALCEAELFGTLPDTPEQVKALLALPQRAWLETWELVCNYCKAPITPQNVESCMQHFKIFARKSVPPDVLKGIQVRRAAKTLAGMKDGEKLVHEIGTRGLGAKWDEAVRVVIDADQERMNQVTRGT